MECWVLGVRRLVSDARWRAVLALAACYLPLTAAFADVHYVSPHGGHSPPFTNWAGAAVTIQAAIDVAESNDTILVSNGVYDVGSRFVDGADNRVALTNAVTVRSVNGPDVTVVVGRGLVGDTAIRCAYVGDGAMLSGFLLTNGHTRSGIGQPTSWNSGGGAWCSNGGVVSNCVMAGCKAASRGGGAYGGTLLDSVCRGNAADAGGGAADCLASNCVFTGNTGYGGGVYGGAVYDSLISSNATPHSGAGAAFSDLVRCTIRGNASTGHGSGGGVCAGTARQCLIVGNAAANGGGASLVLENCLIAGNEADSGGGTWRGTVVNCTIVDNRAKEYGGGVRFSTVRNSIIYHNKAARSGDNYDAGSYEYCCTMPRPNGTGHVTNRPFLVALNNPHILPVSPCRNMGSDELAPEGRDIDGEERVHGGRVDIGCDEFIPGAAVGGLSVAVATDWTNVAAGAELYFRALIDGRATATEWDWGDGSVTSNRHSASHVYRSGGQYEVVLQAWNDETHASATVAVHVVAAFTNYVSAGGGGIRPYTNRLTAATNIQDAIDACLVGGTVLVTEGTYRAGECEVRGMRNRVHIWKPVTVLAENPAEGGTVIEGRGPLGTDAVRCAYVGEGAVLSGFTLSGGYTERWGDAENEMSGGGAWCEAGGTVFNCLVTACHAQSQGGGVYGGLVVDSVIRGNHANKGGGCAHGRVADSAVSGNEASGEGGGCYIAVVDGSLIESNTAYKGGGAADCVVSGSTIRGNSADGGEGGGVYDGTTRRCVLSGNRANLGAGAAGFSEDDCLLENCLITGNTSTWLGGGVFKSTVVNCTITGNLAQEEGGGIKWSTARNCIIYYNRAVVVGDNWRDTFDNCSYCCTTPLPAGTGNITNRPELVGLSNPHIVAVSPCVDAGNNGYAPAGTEIDGQTRIHGAAVDMGCDEVIAGSVTGELSVSILAGETNVVAGFEIEMTARIDGAATGYSWDWGDGGVSSNAWRVRHVYSEGGDYDVVLWAWNDETAAAATVGVHVVGEFTNYVSLAGGNVPPYATWETAATNIQDAIDANFIRGTVLVAPGLYEHGAYEVHGTRNRIGLWKAVTVRATDPDPAMTRIVGSGPVGTNAVRCAYVRTGAELVGFTLTNGHTQTSGDRYQAQSGGGAWCEEGGVVSNCVVTGCEAHWHAGGVYGGVVADSVISGNQASSGGGASDAIVRGCTLRGNSAYNYGGGAYRGSVHRSWIVDNEARGAGGGAYESTVENCFVARNRSGDGGGTYDSTVANCTVVDNSAGDDGGGTIYGTVRNSIVYGNRAIGQGANWRGGNCTYCCTTPMPAGTGNITNRPGLIGLHNPHIVSVSPCVNAGENSHAPAYPDIDGEPRVHGGTVDIGCDEVIAGSVTGELSVAIAAPYTNAIVGDAVELSATIDGAATAYAWDWGDGWVSSNAWDVAHVYSAAGTYEVVLRAWNDEGQASASVGVKVYRGFTNYVSLSGSGIPPYSTWETAATNVQDAIDACIVGGEVLVATGIYAGGEYEIHGARSRVGLWKPLTVVAENPDPAQTVIMGSGPADAVRCAYVSAGACLAGFTLTSGYTDDQGDEETVRSGGGAWCEEGGSVSNCIVSGCRSEAYGGGVYGGVVEQCVISSNTAAWRGSGCCSARVLGCVVRNNYGTLGGGGVYDCAVHDSLIEWNSSRSRGGGASESVLEESAVRHNFASSDGGGVFGGESRRCIIMDNDSGWDGGGASYAALENCLLTGNEAVKKGGGMNGGYATNCTITGNRAHVGGGVESASLRNSIVYYNTAMGDHDTDNWSGVNGFSCIWESSCSLPLPPGIGNITNLPGLVGLSNGHIVAASPCVDAGDNRYTASDRDIDGDVRIHGGTVDMGCDEVIPGSVTGVLNAAIVLENTNVVVGHALGVEAAIEGVPAGYEWRWGDGDVSGHSWRTEHAYSAAGDYEIVLHAWNDEMAAAATVSVHVTAGFTNYVSPGGSGVFPYGTWETGATNVQDAIDACAVGGTVLVAPGIYTHGGREYGGMHNRAALWKPLTVMATDRDPARTVIRGRDPVGSNAVRCAIVSAGARLVGFTLTNGHTRATGDVYTERSGGGVWCESGAIVSNCVIVGNQASLYGGGVYGGIVRDAAIRANRAANGGGTAFADVGSSVLASNTAVSGGGGHVCVVRDSLVEGNSAGNGGGVSECDLFTCTVRDNSAAYSGGGVHGGAVRRCVIATNRAGLHGGGADQANVENSLITGNAATNSGGGTYWGTAASCTIVGNVAGEGAGGTDGTKARNSIMYYNVLSQSRERSNWKRGDCNQCCTWPLPAGEGNFTNAPGFVDMPAGDFRLQAFSRCIDAGRNEEWMFDGVDLGGGPRILNGAVDIGAYETPFVLGARVFLAGAYEAAGEMRTDLAADRIPLTSPYADNARTVPRIPSNAVDWILVQVQEGTNSTPIISRSAFLRHDGYIVATDGSPGVTVPVVEGDDYYLVLKHRNHLSVMSATPVVFLARFTSYDFTTGPDRCWPGANACVRLGSDAWGMIPGDADGDGDVTPVDRDIVHRSHGKTGYLNADLNLDGVVDGDD